MGFYQRKLLVQSIDFKAYTTCDLQWLTGLILKTEEIRINFFSGAIYTNRPAETCYLHATDVELRKKLEIFVKKYQKTETTISFYGKGLKFICFLN